jgi:hypothetical protein
MIDKTLAHKVLFENKLEKAKSNIRVMKSKSKSKLETEEQFQKKVERVEWLQDHICNLHERHLRLQYEVKIACNEEL